MKTGTQIGSFTRPNLDSNPRRASYVKKRPKVSFVKTMISILLVLSSGYLDHVYLLVMFTRSHIGIFNDPVSFFAVPRSLLLWLSLYFSGFVCIASPSQRN